MPTQHPSFPVSVPIVAASPSWSKRLQLMRHNLLSGWEEKDYNSKSREFTLFRQQYILCNSPDTVRRVFLELHDNYDRKGPQMRHALEPLLGDGLFVSDGELWRERRAYCAPAFEQNLMPDFAAIMIESASNLVAHWKSLPAGQPVDMLNEMARLTARIIGRTVFGDKTPDSDAAQIVDGFSEYQRFVVQSHLSDAFGLPWLRWVQNPWRRFATQRAAKKVHKVIDGIIDRYKQGLSGDRFSLISLLLDGRIAGSTETVCPLGAEAARNEAIVMFMAGHETTANVLAWTWYLLDFSPDAMVRLHEELDRVLGGRLPTLDDIEQLPYTRAVLEEAMRLYPPVPVLTRQARASDEFRGRKVKPDAIMFVVPWLLHRHRQYWEDPDAFRPERFLPGQPRPNKFVYLPFSVGHRVCLGKKFGLYEAILCLATLAQHFSPALVPGHQVEIECRLTLRPKGGLPMLLNAR